jgi:hypothetical protein
MQANYYWYGTPDANNANNAWVFNLDGGNQNTVYKLPYSYAIAVHDGDVLTTVPEPETYTMMLFGLGFICAVVRYRRHWFSSIIDVSI